MYGRNDIERIYEQAYRPISANHLSNAHQFSGMNGNGKPGVLWSPGSISDEEVKMIEVPGYGVGSMSVADVKRAIKRLEKDISSCSNSRSPYAQSKQKLINTFTNALTKALS